MMRTLIGFMLALVMASPALAFHEAPTQPVNPLVIIPPVTPDAYGPGINKDGTGRPFTWQPDPGYGPADPFSRVKPDVYGPGVGQDQYGRPVRPCAWPCQGGR